MIPDVRYPSAISISAPRGLEDYAPHARDYAVEIKFAFRVNAEIEANGRTLISGWRESAATKATVFVSSPINADAALKAVREMERELAGTLRNFQEIPEHLVPIMTGVPLGFRIVGTPRIVNRSRPRKVGYIGDIVGDIRDAIARKVRAFEELFATMEVAS